MNYIIVILGWALGMAMFVTVRSIHIQRSRKYTCGFWDAFKIYWTKDTGPLVLSAIVMICGVFILPGMFVYANSIAAGTVPTDSYKAKIVSSIVANLRPYSIFFGLVSQGLGFLAVSKAGRWLVKVDQLTDDQIQKLGK